MNTQPTLIKQSIRTLTVSVLMILLTACTSTSTTQYRKEGVLKPIECLTTRLAIGHFTAQTDQPETFVLQAAQSNTAEILQQYQLKSCDVSLYNPYLKLTNFTASHELRIISTKRYNVRQYRPQSFEKERSIDVDIPVTLELIDLSNQEPIWRTESFFEYNNFKGNLEQSGREMMQNFWKRTVEQLTAEQIVKP